METILFYIALAIAGTAFVWFGSGNLETSAERLAVYHHLPATVQGALIAAVGSSFPELSATILATLIHGQFDLGVAAVVGSAIFNILVIPSVSGLVGGKLTTDITLVYKDAQFYITAVIVLLLTFCFAVIYNPVEEGALIGEIDRRIALVPVLLYLLYIFLQHQDAIEHRSNWKPLRDEASESVRPLVEWGRLAIGLVLIVAGVEGLVRSSIAFGEFLGTPSFFWGLTIIALGTSLPDAFISIRAAHEGKATVSLANVLGSNIFDLLVAVPAGVLIAGAVAIDFTIAAPLMGILTIASIMLFTALRTSLTLSRKECYLLLGLYVVLIAWIILEKSGVFQLLF